MFKEIRRTPMPQYNGVGIFYVHDRTGMEAFHLKNDSTELCGDFIFSTPSEDSTGCAHILEHTVLCGSGRYPVKDPFSQMMVSSPNTFLNAMTYTDKTMYPFASPLKKDFDILFSVYADAVFNPLLRRESFNQEGIRYFGETFDGVVYNEMTGADSSEDSILDNAIAAKLFEGTAAQHDSGGDPHFIPDLTYEEYLARYRKWYSPSNCMFYLYGDLDAQEYFSILEERYLGEDNLKKWDNVKIIPSPDRYKLKYNSPQKNSASCPNKTAASAVLTWLTGPSTDPLEVMTLSILTDILLGTPRAPLYREITRSELGQDLNPNSGMGAHTPYMTFTVGFTGCAQENKAGVEAFLLDTLKKIADTGLNKDEVEAAIRRTDFRLREVGSAGMPYGLRIALNMAKFWARGVAPESAMDERALLEKIRKAVSEGPYFENFIRRCLLENPVRLFTVTDYDPEYGDKLKSYLNEKFNRKMSQIDKSLFGEQSKAFDEFINRQDSEEDLAKIDRISLADMPEKIPEYKIDTEVSDCSVFAGIPKFTNSIVYLDMAFRADFLNREELEILPVLIKILHMCGTSKENYIETGKKLRLLTGDFSVFYTPGSKYDGSFTSFISVRVKALSEYFSQAADLVREILTDADLSDISRIKDSLTELVTSIEQGYPYSAHSYALMYAASSFSPVMLANDISMGTRAWISFNRMKKLDENGLKDLSVRLTNLRDKLFCRQGATFVVCCDDNEVESNVSLLKKNIKLYPQGDKVRTPYKPEVNADDAKVHQVLTLSSGPAFNARALSLSFENDDDLVDDLLLCAILSNGWLWTQVRGKGGAYGVFNNVDPQERIYGALSYRDPSVESTFDAFRMSLDQLPGSEDIEHTVVTIIGRELRPVNPNVYCSEAMRHYLFGMTDEDYLKRRKRLLCVTPEDLKRAAKRIACAMDSFCADATVCSADTARTINGKVTELPV